MRFAFVFVVVVVVVAVATGGARASISNGNNDAHLKPDSNPALAVPGVGIGNNNNKPAGREAIADKLPAPCVCPEQATLSVAKEAGQPCMSAMQSLANCCKWKCAHSNDYKSLGCEAPDAGLGAGCPQLSPEELAPVKPTVAAEKPLASNEAEKVETAGNNNAGVEGTAGEKEDASTETASGNAGATVGGANGNAEATVSANAGADVAGANAGADVAGANTGADVAGANPRGPVTSTEAETGEDTGKAIGISAGAQDASQAPPGCPAPDSVLGKLESLLQDEGSVGAICTPAVEHVLALMTSYLSFNTHYRVKMDEQREFDSRLVVQPFTGMVDSFVEIVRRFPLASAVMSRVLTGRTGGDTAVSGASWHPPLAVPPAEKATGPCAPVLDPLNEFASALALPGCGGNFEESSAMMLKEVIPRLVAATYDDKLQEVGSELAGQISVDDFSGLGMKAFEERVKEGRARSQEPGYQEPTLDGRTLSLLFREAGGIVDKIRSSGNGDEGPNANRNSMLVRGSSQPSALAGDSVVGTLLQTSAAVQVAVEGPTPGVKWAPGIANDVWEAEVCPAEAAKPNRPAASKLGPLLAQTNGCSIPGGWAPYVKTMTPACTIHDVCYVCASAVNPVPDQAACDRHFLLNMVELCNNAYNRKYLHAVQRGWCFIAAGDYTAAVQMFGGKHFKPSLDPAKPDQAKFINTCKATCAPRMAMYIIP